MTTTNMTCRRSRRKNRKNWRNKRERTDADTELRSPTLLKLLTEWSRLHPYGITKKVDVEKQWRFQLIQAARKSHGAHIHTSTSLWKYNKINLGTAQIHHMEWLTVPKVTLCGLNKAAEQCLSTALSAVAIYENCARCRCERGAIWNLPCGDAFEICSLIFQPHGSLQQRVHKDGYTRFALPGAEDVLCHNFF